MNAGESSKLPLVVIVGPTASGKTALSIDLAKRFAGEIICADSRTIYKGMDIGTAKPTVAERREIPHWGLDLVNPDEHFTAADFQKYATKKIAEIRARGHVPFLVGGTGLYVDAVVFRYTFALKADPIVRKNLEDRTVDELQVYCIDNNIPLPENRRNKRHLIRVIERHGTEVSREQELDGNTLMVGIATDKEILLLRIRERASYMFEAGIVEETARLSKTYGWNCESMSGNVYPIMREYLEGRISLTETKDKFTTRDWQLAKRQLTWLRRNKYINWLPIDEIETYLKGLLVAE